MELVSIIVSAVFLVISSVFYLRSQLPKQTIQNQKELIETYEKRLKALEDQANEDKKQHIENVKAIADLQGQIKVYKEIPLQSIADSMKELAATNRQILALLPTATEVTRTTQTIKTV
jgi:flagellar motility protein MotE (MotC chaperone)